MTTTTLARAWAVLRADGLRLGFTDHDTELRFEGMRFRPDSGLTARALMQGAGLAVDNTEAEGALSDDAITERDLMAGRWDGADLRLWEVDWRDVSQRRLIFSGSLGEVTRASGAFRAELRGLTEPLGAPLGRVYHPRCAACLGDAACRVELTPDSLRHETGFASCDEGRVFRFNNFPAYDAGWFEHGVLLVLDGGAEGLKSAIKSDVASPGGLREMELWEPLAIIPQPGDRLRLTAGCDKRAATCRTKFANFLNFRGFPHLPPEDWLIAPQAAGRHG